MCTVSMVMDHYFPRIPHPDVVPTTPTSPFPLPTVIPLGPSTLPTTPVDPTVPLGPLVAPLDLSELRRLLDEFRQAFAAAKTVDKLTSQPDCEDEGKKAPLLDRVAELERRLKAIEGIVGIKP